MLAAVLFAAASAGLNQPAPSQRVMIDAGQLLAIAADWERRGMTAQAAQSYRALLQDGNIDFRTEARFRLAKLAIAGKQWNEAGILLRRILDEKPDAKPVRLALAEVLAQMGDENAALRELRAVQAGGLPLDVARAVDRFSDALRARKPFGASIELALAPDSNINQATSGDTLGTVIGDFTIDPDGRRTSGVGMAVRSTAYVRHSLGDSISLLVRGSTAADLYRKSDFNHVAASVSAGPEFRLGTARFTAELGASQRWYGGKAYERSLRLGLSGSYPLDGRTVARAGLSLAKVDNRLNDLQDGTDWGGEIGLERALNARTGLAVTLSGERADLADPGYATRAWRAQLVGWRDIGRATVHASAAYGRLEADERLSLFPERRKESAWRLGVGATLRHLQVSGFAPIVRYSIERNKSSIAIYDYTRRRAEFGIVRAF